MEGKASWFLELQRSNPDDNEWSSLSGMVIYITLNQPGIEKEVALVFMKL